MFIYNSIKKNLNAGRLKLWRIRIHLPKITFLANYDTKKRFWNHFFTWFHTLVARKKTNKQNKSTKNYLEPLGQNSSTYREWNLGVLNEVLIIYIYHNFYRWRILFSKYNIRSFLEQWIYVDIWIRDNLLLTIFKSI